MTWNITKKYFLPCIVYTIFLKIIKHCNCFCYCRFCVLNKDEYHWSYKFIWIRYCTDAPFNLDKNPAVFLGFYLKHFDFMVLILLHETISKTTFISMFSLFKWQTLCSLYTIKVMLFIRPTLLSRFQILVMNKEYSLEREKKIFSMLL